MPMSIDPILNEALRNSFFRRRRGDLERHLRRDIKVRKPQYGFWDYPCRNSWVCNFNSLGSYLDVYPAQHMSVEYPIYIYICVRVCIFVCVCKFLKPYTKNKVIIRHIKYKYPCTSIRNKTVSPGSSFSYIPICIALLFEIT